MTTRASGRSGAPGDQRQDPAADPETNVNPDDVDDEETAAEGQIDDVEPEVKTAPAPAGAVVEDLEPEVAPRTRERRTREVWDGRCTRLELAYPMIRDHKVYGAGDRIVVQACKSPLGKWVGPEAKHVEALLKQGMVAHTKAAAARASRTAAVEHERGAYGTKENPEGRPDLLARTTEQVEEEWARVIPLKRNGDVNLRELLRKERQDSRRTDEEALNSIVQGLLDAATDKHAGAEGPGSRLRRAAAGG